MTLFKRRNEAISSVHLRRLVISAMFLAIALVVRTLFRMYIPIFGESGMRISVHGIFSAMPAILFGPVYGAIVSGLTDFIGFHLSPAGGAWLPQLTATAALGGFVRGGLWMMLRMRSTALMRKWVVFFAVVLVCFGAWNMASLNADGIGRDFYEPFAQELAEGSLTIYDYRIDRDFSIIGRMAVTRTINMSNPAEGLNDFITFVTTAMIGSGIFGLLLVGIDWAAGKYLIKGGHKVPTMSLLLAMMTAAVLISTINTIIFRYTIFPSWQLLPFSVVWLPRVVQTIASTTLMTYFIAMLLGVCERQPHLRQWMR
jgi:ECF transporter S component (folate family)